MIKAWKEFRGSDITRAPDVFLWRLVVAAEALEDAQFTRDQARCEVARRLRQLDGLTFLATGKERMAGKSLRTLNPNELLAFAEGGKTSSISQVRFIGEVFRRLYKRRETLERLRERKLKELTAARHIRTREYTDSIAAK